MKSTFISREDNTVKFTMDFTAEEFEQAQIKAYQHRTAALVENGSWAPSAGRVMKEMLGAMKDVSLVEPMVTIRGRMHADDEPRLQALADKLAKDFEV